MIDIYDFSMAKVAEHLSELSRVLGFKIGVVYAKDGDVAAFVVGRDEYLDKLDADIWERVVGN